MLYPYLQELLYSLLKCFRWLWERGMRVNLFSRLKLLHNFTLETMKMRPVLPSSPVFGLNLLLGIPVERLRSLWKLRPGLGPSLASSKDWYTKSSTQHRGEAWENITVMPNSPSFFPHSLCPLNLELPCEKFGQGAVCLLALCPKKKRTSIWWLTLYPLWQRLDFLRRFLSNDDELCSAERGLKLH